MSRIEAMRRVCPGLLLLLCSLAISGCATSSQAARPIVCPVLPHPPSNVMRPPNYEARLRALLFKSESMPTTTSTPATP